LAGAKIDKDTKARRGPQGCGAGRAARVIGGRGRARTIRRPRGAPRSSPRRGGRRPQHGRGCNL